MTRPVTVTIDVLAVSGLDAAQARAFGAALERELTWLLARPQAEWPARDDAAPAASGDIAICADRPDRAAGLVARAIYQRVAG